MKDIAIIGMAGRFPEADTIEEFYQNLRNGKDCVKPFSEKVCQERSIPYQWELDIMGYLEDIDKFDHKFFNIPLGEAQHIDPVQRFMMEVAYETIESSGYSVEHFAGSKTSVYLSHADYKYLYLFPETSKNEPTLFTSINHFATAGRISRFLDLRGNASVINTGCSSALNAFHLACNEILLGEVDHALVGGMRLEPAGIAKKQNVFDVGIQSHDGLTKSFSANSNGSGEGEMIGCVLLKRLDKAIEDKDNIFAVVKATVATQSGQLASSLTATNGAAQSEMLREAWKKAGIDPLTITHIEAHGSGTKLGDPMEIAGIDGAFKGLTDKKHFVSVSSVKSNINHTDTGAGLAGLMKGVLEVKNKELFPSLHFDEPNPFIDFNNSVTYINTELKKWEPECGIARMGVNSLGFTGNNVHVILEEPPVRIVETDTKKPYFISISAKTVSALKQNIHALNKFISTNESAQLRDVSYTLNTGRKHYDQRFAAVVSDKSELSKILWSVSDKDFISASETPDKILFVFSDTCSFSEELIAHLSNHYPVFKLHFDSCASKTTQPGVRQFAFQYALAQFLFDGGIQTKNLVGLGIGKLVTNVLSGKITLAEGIQSAESYVHESVDGLVGRLQSMVERETESSNALFVEMGFPSSISNGLKALPADLKQYFSVFTLEEKSTAPIQELIKSLYLSNVAIEWKKYATQFPGFKIELPTYRFDKIRCWIEGGSYEGVSMNGTKSASTEKMANLSAIEEEYTVMVDKKIDPSWSPTEKIVAGIWMDVLSNGKVRLTDDFFSIGGHSLFLIKVNNKLEKEFRFKFDLKEMFAFSTVKSLSAAIDMRLGSKGEEVNQWSIPAIPQDEYYPLSAAQKRLWVVSQFSETSVAYNLPQTYIFEGELNKPAFEKAFITLLERHESLRTVFVQHNGETFQKILDTRELNFSVKEFDFTKQENQDERVFEFIKADAISPFDLSKGPLLRVKLLKLNEQKHVVAFNMHHIVGDGWSATVMVNEVLALYEAFRNNMPNPLPALRIHYKDYAAWQNEKLGGDLQEHKNYWISKFEGELPVLNLPSAHVRPAAQTYNGSLYQFSFDQELMETVVQLSRKNNLTLFMTLLAGLKALFFRYTGQTDMILGTPVAGRDHEDLENQIGFYINMLPLRTRFQPEDTFPQFAEKVRTTCIEGFEHQLYPFEQLVDNLSMERDLSRSPLFDVVLILHNMMEDGGNDEEGFAGLKVAPYPAPHQVSQRDMTFNFTQMKDKIEGSLEYNTDIYSETGVARMIEHLKQLFNAVAQDNAVPLAHLNYLGTEETRQLLVEYNRTDSNYPAEKTILELIAQQVKENPKSIAVQGLYKNITYQELEERSAQLAATLKIKKGAVVAQLAYASEEAVIGILAIMKAGGVYLPIDPEYPEERKAFMLKDSGTERILIQGNLLETNAALLDEFIHPVYVLEDERNYTGEKLPAAHLGPNDPAYIIYTSGTTGHPKGVVIHHQGLVNYISWAVKEYVGTKAGNFPLYTSLAFDLTITSIFTPLVTGNQIVVYFDQDKTQIIEKIFSENRVNVVKLTPAHLKLLKGKKISGSSIRCLILGGENLDTKIATEIHKAFDGKIEICNEYGPTETVVGCMIHRFNPATDTNDYVPIGKPADNVKIYLLDNFMQPVGIGVPGQIYISGDGVAKEYLNRPELTADKFVSNPFEPGRSMYKTGDQARFIDADTIEFIGRIDSQIKIRGYRVELGEIEAQLAALPQVNDVVVEVKKQYAVVKHSTDPVTCCVKCGLPSNYPNVTFDSHGVCDTCITFDSYKEKAEAYFRTMDDFQALVQEVVRKKTGEYDCMMLLSGGKDSTYVLYQLVREMKLKPLVFSFDNGFISQEAKDNIKRVTDELAVDLVWGSTKHMNEIFVDSLNRFSNVCNGCFKTIYTLALNLAVEKNIKLIVTGLSRGQLFETRLNELYNTSKIFDAQQIDDYIIDARKTYHRADDAVSKLLDTRIFSNEKLFEDYQIVDYYRYSEVKLEEMYAYLEEHAPWTRPSDTGRSTNCLINELGIYVHKKERGFHNYALPYSWDVRMGHKTRKEALEELDDRINRENVRKMLKEIGYDEDRLEKERNETHLVAYLVTGKEVMVSEIRRQLAGKLPEYMIPTDFVVLDKLPLTSNGKVDRKALPDPEGLSLRNKYIAPRNEMEQLVATNTEEVLGKKKVSVRDSFFEIGGHSLKAVQLIAKLNNAFSVNLSLPNIYAHPTIESLATFISRLNKAEFSTIETVPQQEHYPVSWNQLNYLGENRLGEAVVYGGKKYEKLDKEAMSKAIDALINRHESMRTIFLNSNGEKVQKVLSFEEVNFHLQETDLRGEQDIEEKLNRIKAEHLGTVFNLEQPPLFRMTLVRTSETGWELFIAVHHITLDGWSIQVLAAELDKLYDAFTIGDEAALPPLTAQYKDFSVWQHRMLQSPEIDVHRNYWHERLANGLPAMELKPEVTGKEKGLAVYDFVLPVENARQLKMLANEQSGSFYTSFLTALNILLSGITGNNEVMTIAPVAGREHDALKGVVGFFVNFLLLNTTVNENRTFREILSETSRDFFEALSHQVYPAEKLFQELNLNINEYPTVILNMHNFDGLETRKREMPLEPHRDAEFESPDKLAFIINEYEDGTEINLVYRKDLFKPATIEQFAQLYLSVLISGATQPDKRINEIILATFEELDV